MRTLRKNWIKLAGVFALGGAAIVAVYACISAWGQTAPVLTIAPTGTNEISITVSNGVSNGLYQLYYREDLTTNYSWVLFTNGATGQTNFNVNLGDTIKGYFEVAYNTNFVTPSISVIILSPTNGALLY